MPRSSTTWSIADAITAARLNLINTDLDDLYAYGNDRGRIIKAVSGTALRIDLKPFAWRVGSTSGQYAGGTDIVVTNSATNYVEIDSTGTIQINTTAFTANNARLGTVTCAGGVVTAISIWKPDVVGGPLGGTSLVNNETLSATRTLIVTDKVNQVLDLNGADRDVVLATSGMIEGNTFNIKNASANGEIITLKQSSTVLATIPGGYSCVATYDGTNWKIMMERPNVTGTIMLHPSEYNSLEAIGYTLPTTTTVLLGPALLGDNFDRADSNTVGGGWTENAVGATSEQISTNRLQLLSVSNGAGRVYQSHGALTLPVRLYAKVVAGSSSNRPIYFGIWSGTTGGSMTGIIFTQQNAAQNIWVNGSSAGTFNYDFSSGTNYIWIDIFPNGSNLDINIYCSTSSTKPTSPNGSASNVAYSTSNTNFIIQGDFSATGQNVYFDEVGIYSLNAPRAVGLAFDQSIKQNVTFKRVLPSNYVTGSKFKARIHWASPSASTNSVVWGIRAVALADNQSLATAYGTAQTVTQANGAAGFKNQTAQTAAVTIAGSPAAGQLCYFEVYRDSLNASDTLAADAIYLGADIQFM